MSGRKKPVPFQQALNQTNYFLIVKASKNPYQNMWIKKLPHEQYYIEAEIVEVIHIKEQEYSDEKSFTTYDKAYHIGSTSIFAYTEYCPSRQFIF